MKTALLFGLLLAVIASSAKAALVEVVNFGKDRLPIVPEFTTVHFEQEAEGLVFPAPAGLGATLGSEFSPIPNWTRFDDTTLGLLMSWSGTGTVAQSFTIEFSDANFELINAYQGNTDGVSSSPTFVPLVLSRSGTRDFSQVRGLQFTWDGGADFKPDQAIKVFSVVAMVEGGSSASPEVSGPTTPQPALATGTKSQRITFRIPRKTLVGKTYRINGRASSRLGVEYMVSDPTVAEIVNLPRGRKGLRILSAGTASVTALQAGDSKWASAAPVTRSFTAWPAKKP